MEVLNRILPDYNIMTIAHEIDAVEASVNQIAGYVDIWIVVGEKYRIPRTLIDRVVVYDNPIVCIAQVNCKESIGYEIVTYDSIIGIVDENLICLAWILIPSVYLKRGMWKSSIFGIYNPYSVVIASAYDDTV